MHASAANGAAAGDASVVNLLEDHRQTRLFLTTVGGVAATVEHPYQVVGDRRRSKSLKLAGLASDLADQPCLVA
jgi:hypothetical protein